MQENSGLSPANQFQWDLSHESLPEHQRLVQEKEDASIQARKMAQSCERSVIISSRGRTAQGIFGGIERGSRGVGKLEDFEKEHKKPIFLSVCSGSEKS